MKYLLVNEPETCGKCELLFELYWDRAFTTYCGRLHKEVLPWSKCEECPLKPLPEYQENQERLRDANKIYITGYKDGYNACLDEIVGEEE